MNLATPQYPVSRHADVFARIKPRHVGRTKLFNGLACWIDSVQPAVIGNVCKVCRAFITQSSKKWGFSSLGPAHIISCPFLRVLLLRLWTSSNEWVFLFAHVYQDGTFGAIIFSFFMYSPAPKELTCAPIRLRDGPNQTLGGPAFTALCVFWESSMIGGT